MANTAVPNTALAYGSTADVAGTAVVAGNTHVITPTKHDGKVLLRFKNTTASTKVWTLVAGDNPPADQSGVGDLTVSLTDGSTTPQIAWVMADSSRFMQSNGTYEVTVAASTTGTLTAFQLA
jgi:hypothetical protein